MSANFTRVGLAYREVHLRVGVPQRYALVSSRQRARGAPGGGREIEWPAAWVDAMRWAFAYMSLSSSPASSIPRSPAPPVVNSTATAALVRYDVEAVVRCSVGLDYSFRLGHARRRMARRDRSAARDAADGSVVAVEAGVVDEGDGFSFRMAQHEGSREAPWVALAGGLAMQWRSPEQPCSVLCRVFGNEATVGVVSVAISVEMVHGRAPRRGWASVRIVGERNFLHSTCRRTTRRVCAGIV